ncbi:Uncharacterised protein [uncultured archaeon]|nr:Uncharacterised protein [uncultured archaeon]
MNLKSYNADTNKDILGVDINRHVKTSSDFNRR